MANKTIEISIDELQEVACENCVGRGACTLKKVFTCEGAVSRLYNYQKVFGARIAIGGFYVLPRVQLLRNAHKP